jgi:ankyrin repeat protein
MELDLEFPPSTPWGSIIMTDHDHRVAVFLRKAELSPPQRIPGLAELPTLDFQSSLPSNSDAARSLLAQQRTSESGYRRPELQRRHKFRTKGRKEAKCNKDKWIFTKHEVAKAFDGLLSRAPLALPGIAHALLSHASVTSLDELWCHLHDPKLEKRMASRFRRSRSSLVPEIPWLDVVTGQENHEYIRLICQAGLGQEVLDRAFSIALSKHSMNAMEVLLSFGAVASACQDAIRERVILHDLALTRLLLSSPNAMSVEAWRYCMEPEVESLQASGKQSPTILLLCLAHRPDVVCGLLLLKALESQNLQATAIILAYAGFDEDFRDVRWLACELASAVQDDGRRHDFFTMLAESGFVADGPVLREELMKDVKTRQLPLIQLLADAGVSLDIEPHNAVYWAVSHMDLDILELFKRGTFSSPVSLALNFVPESTSEPDMLRLVEIFAPMGLAGEPLNSHLVRAVRKQHIPLVDTLLRYGASVEFEQASAIRTALEKPDFDILSILLQSKCSPEILSATIPTAMVLQPRPSRLQAIKALVEKGVLNQNLSVPLQRLVSEDGDVDSELIQLLLQHKAPVDGVGDDANNAVLAAARRGNLSVLRMLCDAGPRNETLSEAVPVAFGVMHTCGYDVALDTIKLLLQKGAAGLPTHKTLLTAAKQDYRLDIVRLLIKHGAEANYATGASFAVALETANFKLLEILCAGCPPTRASTESVLFTAIDPRHYNLKALELLLGSTTSVAAALNALWTSEKFRSNPNMTAIVPCFLRHGLNVNLGNGLLLCFAIQEKRDPILLGRILSANPSINSLTTAFQAATSVQPRNVELEMMRLLLEKAESAEIGQSESLLQQTHAALAGDFVGFQLLLRHKAVVDFDDGRAVQAAAAAGSLKVLDLLLLFRPAPFTLNRACLAAASSGISWDKKQSVLEHLLAANGGILAEDMSKLLADSVASLPEYTQLPQLLLARRAEVNFETLKVALGTSSRNLFVALASSIQSANTVVRMFRHARQTTIVPDRRYWIYQYLFGRGIPSDDVSEALLDSLKADNLGDLSLLKLLLEHGAAVSYKNGAAFSLALRANSLEAVRLLSQYLVDDGMAGVAFDLARKTALLNPHVRVEVYRCLLQWNISKSSIYHALVENFKGGHSDISVVQLLLANGADPNEDEAYCLVVASRAGAEPEFRALSKYVKLRVLLKALLNHFQEEWEVVWWFNVCLEEQPYSAKIDQDELLFQCMRKFPRGTVLLKLIFDIGVSASAKVAHCLCAGWQPEPCTALIWALFSTPRIENDAILVLLARGGDTGLLHVHHILYTSPQG